MSRVKPKVGDWRARVTPVKTTPAPTAHATFCLTLLLLLVTAVDEGARWLWTGVLNAVIRVSLRPA